MYTNQKLIASYTLRVDEIDYAEYCHFNMQAYQELLTYILLIRDEYNAEYSLENYKHFMQEYKEARQKYFICLRHLLEVHAPEFMYSQLHEVVLNFDEMAMHIYLKNSVDGNGPELEGDK